MNGILQHPYKSAVLWVPNIFPHNVRTGTAPYCMYLKELSVHYNSFVDLFVVVETYHYFYSPFVQVFNGTVSIYNDTSEGSFALLPAPSSDAQLSQYYIELANSTGLANDQEYELVVCICNMHVTIMGQKTCCFIISREWVWCRRYWFLRYWQRMSSNSILFYFVFGIVINCS